MKLILFFFCLYIPFICLSQDTTGSLIIYRDDDLKLNKAIFQYVTDNFPMDEVKSDTYSNENIYLDKTGKITNIDIRLIGDSLLIDVIYRAIKATDGKWKNFSGGNQIVNMSIISNYLENYIQKDPKYTFFRHVMKGKSEEM